MGKEPLEEINNGLESMTHFVLFWSKNCEDAPWVHRELNVAISQLIGRKLPVIVVRLDGTSVPAIISDIFRIDCIEEDAPEIGKLISKTVKRLEKKKKIREAT